jgi:hypothetical protein
MLSTLGHQVHVNLLRLYLKTICNTLSELENGLLVTLTKKGRIESEVQRSHSFHFPLSVPRSQNPHVSAKTTEKHTTSTAMEVVLDDLVTRGSFNEWMNLISSCKGKEDRLLCAHHLRLEVDL